MTVSISFWRFSMCQTATVTRNGHRNGNGQPSSDVQQRKVERWLELKERAKELYEQADRLEAELIGLIGPRALLLDDGRSVSVADNFVDKHGQPKAKAFGICGVRRFELKIK